MKNYITLLVLLLLTHLLHAQVITTFAGIGGESPLVGYGYGVGYYGEDYGEGFGNPAGSFVFVQPLAVAVDHKWNVYIVDGMGDYVAVVNTAGIINLFAGGGSNTGDGEPATSAKLEGPEGIAVDNIGNVYITDDCRIRKVDTAGIISTCAGVEGNCGYSGDGGPATSAALNLPTSITIDFNGNIFFADDLNSVIRKINTAGIIITVAGNGINSYSGDGGPATDAAIGWPTGVAVDQNGNLYIANDNDNRVRKVDTFGIINTYAGSGSVDSVFTTCSFSGDGWPATAAQMCGPDGIYIDKNENVYIADEGNQRIRKISYSGIISTFAGSGPIGTSNGGYAGDGGLATNALLDRPVDVAVDTTGNVYIVDYANYCIRKVIINGVAGVNNINNPTQAINIFPNPVSAENNLHVNGLQFTSTYSILTAIGTEVQIGYLPPGNNTLSLNTLPPAVYILQITASDGQKTITKIIKQ